MDERLTRLGWDFVIAIGLVLITLLPLVIPSIVIVFGYIRLYNTSSWLPMTGSVTTTNMLLMFGYVTLALPYMYRSVDTGLRTIDVATLTEAAQSLGATPANITRPAWSVIGRDISQKPTPIAPTAGAACSTPRPTGPTCKMSRA